MPSVTRRAQDNSALGCLLSLIIYPLLSRHRQQARRSKGRAWRRSQRGCREASTEGTGKGLGFWPLCGLKHLLSPILAAGKPLTTCISVCFPLQIWLPRSTDPS